MFKLLGIITVLAITGLGIGVVTGAVNFKAQASLTPQGQQQLKQARSSLADVVEGK